MVLQVREIHCSEWLQYAGCVVDGGHVTLPASINDVWQLDILANTAQIMWNIVVN